MSKIEHLQHVGLLNPYYGGVQIDLNSAITSEKREISLCNHNCTSERGGYTCPASFSQYKRVKTNYPPLSLVKQWISHAHKASIKQKDTFLNEHIDIYLESTNAGIEKEILVKNLNSGKFEVNLFGGNPEMYPDVIPLINDIKTPELDITLTTTGRRFLTQKTFRDQVLASKLDTIALSLDDLDTKKFSTLASCNLEQLKQGWKTIDPLWGQAQKAIEALYTAQLLKDSKIQILFNVVIHPNNISQVLELYFLLTHEFPQAKLNFFLFQTRFSNETQLLDENFLKQLDVIVDFFIEKTKSSTNVVKRLHYWWILRAILDSSLSRMRKSDLLLGEAWKCYKKPLLMYLQLGKSNGLVEENSIGSGKLGCFWNENSINTNRMIRDSSDITEYLEQEIYFLGVDRERCAGCLMPRLISNAITTELGLDSDIVHGYEELKRDYLLDLL